ncbi:hypothetical protein ACFV4G_43410 [Kitasatospora sp. NPDC059747]|jgi:hypothetical protein|uniref:hypothetical protein n=1 Tax=Kitasatospora sp. NPDC059747 TaxID=3346930 RepID=UPI003656A454
MARQQRIDHFNLWPKAQKFEAEKRFAELLEPYPLEDLFFPYQLPDTDNKESHIMISYLLDAVDSLPYRPDHAFDWVWRAFEFSCKQVPGCKENTTKALRSVSTKLDDYFVANSEVGDAFFDLVSRVPIRTCKFLLKKIVDEGGYEFVGDGYKGFSIFAKRLLFANGAPPVVSASIQSVLHYLSWHYRAVGGAELRNGATLLRRILRGEKVELGGIFYQLSRPEILFLTLSGLAYAFRNGRAHAESIAPFRSSLAKVQTYAHCWFMFLIIYELTFALQHISSYPNKLIGAPADNFRKNNAAFSTLFKSCLGS